MIIVNYWQDSGYNPDTDGYGLTLAAVVSDTLDLLEDIDLIKECIDNSEDFKPVDETLYELYLERAIIRYSPPASEGCFALTKIVTKKYDLDRGHYTPLIDLT